MATTYFYFRKLGLGLALHFYLRKLGLWSITTFLSWKVMFMVGHYIFYLKIVMGSFSSHTDGETDTYSCSTPSTNRS